MRQKWIQAFGGLIEGDVDRSDVMQLGKAALLLRGSAPAGNTSAGMRGRPSHLTPTTSSCLLRQSG